MSGSPPVQNQQHFKRSLSFKEGKTSNRVFWAASTVASCSYLPVFGSIKFQPISFWTTPRPNKAGCRVITLRLFDPRIGTDQISEGFHSNVD